MSFSKLVSGLDNRQFYGLVLGATLIVIAAVVSFVLMPQVRAHKLELKNHAELPELPFDEQVLARMLSERDLAVADIAHRLHGDMANLPAREIEAFVIDKLQDIAWNHDVVLQGVKPSKGESIGSFSEILFKLDLTGQYGDLFSWLHELRNELGFIVVKEYRMDRLSKENMDPVLRVQITIASYRKESS